MIEPLDKDAQPPRPAACLACGSGAWLRCPRQAERIGIDPPDALIRCAHCRFAWIDRNRVAAFQYDATYFEYYASRKAFAGGQSELPTYLHDRLARLNNLVGGPGRLLEVGCGMGLFLLEAQMRGWSVLGIESTEAATQPGRSLGIDVRAGELAALDGPFDLAHLNHVLEHVEDPQDSLRQLARLIRPGGILAIEVPNELESLYDRMRFALLQRFDPPLGRNVHRSFFDPTSLARIVKRAGFEIIHLATPRRNRQPDSRLPLGGLVKQVLYGIEARLRRGPNIEIFARRPSSLKESACPSTP